MLHTTYYILSYLYISYLSIYLSIYLSPSLSLYIYIYIYITIGEARGRWGREDALPGGPARNQSR